MTSHLNRKIDLLVCINCRSVGTLEHSADSLECAQCGYTFPVFDHIPILLQEPASSLVAAYLQHKGLIEENQKMLEGVRDARALQPDRAVLLDRAIQAYESNNQYLRTCQDAIASHVPQSEIDKMKADDRLPRQYALDEGIVFFHRDWCWTNRAENEIRVIVDAVRAQIEAYASDVDTVLVPGAGAGRFACELAGTFDACYAFDYCVHMAQIFYDLVERGLTLYRVNLRSNVIRREDVVIENVLSIDASGERRIRKILEQGRLTYFVGNALDVPIAAGSLSAIACIYFIDLVSIKTHLKEIGRTLKPNGLFINFGPLRYMKKDVIDMFSGEELMDLFEASGFDILTHDTVTNTQLASSPVITSVLSHNFMFVARKRK